ncbi:hypothetical protein PATSB16_19280 [Pandoraea thiooxydans]|nr:hypothetical protein PATSB16_19280 [Pandoraea thiooxydans]
MKGLCGQLRKKHGRCSRRRFDKTQTIGKRLCRGRPGLIRVI